MKKILFTLFMFIIGGFYQISNGQSPSNNENVNKSRTVYFYVEEMMDAADVSAVVNYLMQFEGKIESAKGEPDTQMLTVDLMNLSDQDVEELIYQAGYKGFQCQELPPAGQKYIHNPDGTWKIKSL